MDSQSPPSFFELHLGYNCNSRCKICFVGDRERREHGPGLAMPEIQRQLRTMRGRGIKELHLFGGEPLVRPDIVRICACARVLGFEHIVLFTNGTKLADRGLAAKLAACGVDYASVSVYAPTARAHEAITGVPGSFAKTVAGIKNLLEAGIDTAIICVINRLNHEMLARYAEYFAGLGVKRFTFFNLRYLGRADFSLPQTKEVAISMSLAAASLRPALAVLDRLKIRHIEIEHFNACVLPDRAELFTDLYKDMADARGKIYSLHPALPLSDIMKQSYKGRIKPPSCAECPLEPHCPGIEKPYAELFGTAEFKPLGKMPSGLFRRG